MNVKQQNEIYNKLIEKIPIGVPKLNVVIYEVLKPPRLRISDFKGKTEDITDNSVEEKIITVELSQKFITERCSQETITD